jgi:septum formation protein
MIIGRPKFVLASGSPRRLTLINQIGIEPDALRPGDIDEDAASRRAAACAGQSAGARQGGSSARGGEAR